MSRTRRIKRGTRAPRPQYRCCNESCGAEFISDHPTGCRECGHAYVEWLNYAACRAFWDGQEGSSR